MPRGRIKPLVKPFPKERQKTWQQQQLMMKLSNQNQDIREPYLYGKSRSIYTVAKFNSKG